MYKPGKDQAQRIPDVGFFALLCWHSHRGAERQNPFPRHVHASTRPLKELALALVEALARPIEHPPFRR
eukprot:2524712-Rhodomonas_salina.1